VDDPRGRAGSLLLLRRVRAVTRFLSLLAVPILRLASSVVGLVSVLVDGRIASLVAQVEQLEHERRGQLVELRAVEQEAIDLRRRLRIAIDDRDRFLGAWRRCRDGEAVGDPGEPVPLDWRSPFEEPAP